ncbi:MAG TPA: hypothetical protein VF792_11235 [Ktedonobacterales bacterium]
MATTQMSPNAVGTSTAKRRSSLDYVLFAALIVGAILNILPSLLNGRLIPPPMIMAVAALIAAAVLATPWRWGVSIAFIVSLITSAVDLAPGQFPLYTLLHPGGTTFTVILLETLCALLGLVASAVKLTQVARRETPHSTTLSTASLTLVAGIALGAFLIGTFGQSSGTSGNAASVTSGTEVVHLTSDKFAPNIIALHTGETLTVIDDVPVPHILVNGSWSASNPNQAQPATEAGAPVINNVELNNNTKVVGPFATAGTYHIYCSVHPGMNLTVIVA